MLAVPLAIGLTISVLARTESANAQLPAVTADGSTSSRGADPTDQRHRRRVGVVKMAQRGVLAQQLNAIESLASVDIVCTDKTGTLTEPK